jgi:hypothetical protein
MRQSPLPAGPRRNGFGGEAQRLVFVVCGPAPGDQARRHVGELEQVKQGMANPAQGDRFGADGRIPSPTSQATIASGPAICAATMAPSSQPEPITLLKPIAVSCPQPQGLAQMTILLRHVEFCHRPGLAGRAEKILTG